jgi:WD40 repeat protein
LATVPRRPRELRPHESVQAFFGAELRHWMTAKGYSQDELGRLTLHSGDTISKVEKAVRWPTEQLAQRCDMVLDTGGALKRLLPLVLAERRVTGSRDGTAKTSVRRGRLPVLDFGAVRRPDAQGFIVTALLAAAETSQPAPVLIGGPGGFGKTTLALQTCCDDRITSAFDEVLWVETGQDCTAARVVQLVADLCEQLDGTRPVLVNPEQAGFHLAEVLGERRALLVVDNVWASVDLAPFLLGGPNCVRLVTSRNLGVCRIPSATHQVAPMTKREIGQLLENNSPVALSDEAGVRALASLCGGWPLLASVVGASVAQDIAAGATETVAVRRATSALCEDGPHALDVWDAGRREGTIGRVVASSLRHLNTHVIVHGGRDLGDRYLDLAIFPAAVPIPVPVLAAWWRREHGWTTTAVRQFARVLAERSLLGAYLADEDAVVLHDVFRSSLVELARRPAMEAHKSLVDSFRAAAPDRWHRLDTDQRYVWRHLTYHLEHAGHPEEVADILCDPKFVVAKLQSFGHDSLIDDALALERVAPHADAEQVGVARALVGAAYLAAGATRRDDISSTLLVALGWAGRLDTPAAQELRDATGTAFDVRWARPQTVHGDGHTGAVTAAAVAGSRVVSAGEDGSVRVWDRASRRLVRVLRGHHGWVYAVAVSAAGDVVASAGDDAVIRLWSGSSGRPIGVLAGHSKRVRSLAFDRAGRLLVSGSEDGRIIVWTVDPTARVRDLATDGRPTWSVDIGHNDTLVGAGGEDESVRVYDLRTGHLVAERSGHRDWVRVVAFASDAPLLASGSGDGSVCLWNVADGHLALLRSTPTVDRIRALAVSPDAGVIESAGEDATVRTITAAGVVHETSMPAGVDWIRALAADHDELTLGCEDGAVRLLRDRNLSELAAGKDTVWSTALTPDGEFALLGHSDGTIEVNRADSNRSPRRLHAGGGRVWALDAAAGIVAAACGDGAVRVWNLDDPSWSMVLNQDGARAWSVAVHPTGRTLAASSGAGVVQLWDLPTGERRWRCDAHAGRVRSIAFDPTGRVLVTGGGDGAARSWDADTGRQLSDVPNPTGWVRTVAVDNAATRLAAGLGSGDISIRRLDSDTPPVHLFGHGGRILALGFVSDDQLLSAAADGTVRLWSISAQHQLAQVRVDASLQCACVHRQTGSVLVSSSAGVIALELKRRAREM